MTKEITRHAGPDRRARRKNEAGALHRQPAAQQKEVNQYISAFACSGAALRLRSRGHARACVSPTYSGQSTH
jgi:hypothetical protein